MGLVTLGVLRMPLPDDAAEMDVVTWMQVKDRMRDAADEIERLRAALSEIKGIGLGPRSNDVSPDGLRKACGLIASAALRQGDGKE